jgi:hypothetical protein
MMMVRPLFRSALRTVFACGLGVIMATTTPTAVSTVPSVTAMPAMAKHMHRDKSGEEQHPNPVLREPFHVVLLYLNKNIN